MSSGGDFVVSRWRWARVFVLLLIAVAIVAPWIAPFDAENYFDYDRLNDGPSMMHWFGVDSLGAISLAGCWWGRRSRWPPGCWRC
jgi:ABC-type dipeptide/oligopeptide/nickel transport system permease subunit